MTSNAGGVSRQFLPSLLVGFAGLQAIALGGTGADSAINYQGQLKRGGTPANGVFDFQFTLLQANGTTVVERTCAFDVVVVDGLFQAELEFAAASLDGSPRLLQLGVREAVGGIHDCTSNTIGFLFDLLTPLQPITATPYAIHALSASPGSSLDAPDGAPINALVVDNAGRVGIGTTTPATSLHVFRGASGNAVPNGRSLVLEDDASHFLQILAPDAFETGVLFGNPTNGTAAAGVIFNSPGLASGLQFRTGTNDTHMVIDAAGDVGIGNAAPEHPLHVVGTVERTLVVENTGTNTNAVAVFGESASTSGTGVRGEATAATGFVFGVTGISTSSPNGRGVFGRGDLNGVLGQSLAATGETAGVSGSSSSTEGSGVLGRASAATGATRGVHGIAVSPSGFAGFFEGRGSFSGDVAIGVTGGIDARLHVQETGRVAKFDRFGSDGEIVAFANDDIVIGNITNVGNTVSYNAFTGSHYAWSATNIAAGALVSMTGENRRFGGRGDAEPVYGIQETARPNDPACLGVHLGPMESTRELGPENPRLVAAVGNGELCVVDRGGGDIEPGDYLISSDVVGCAMKDDSARFPLGHIVARAGQRVDWKKSEPDATGVRRAMISVLFTNFDRTGTAWSGAASVQQLRAEVETLRSEKVAMAARLARIEALLGSTAAAQSKP